MQAAHHFVIVGGGFAGLWATRALASAPVLVVTMHTSMWASTGSIYAPEVVASVASPGSTPSV